jgi:hypothetical protein
MILQMLTHAAGRGAQTCAATQHALLWLQPCQADAPLRVLLPAAAGPTWAVLQMLVPIVLLDGSWLWT